MHNSVGESGGGKVGHGSGGMTLLRAGECPERCESVPVHAV
jgi:hypothetical protein